MTWFLSMLEGLGLLYDEVVALVQVAKEKFPALADALAYLEEQLRARVGDKVKDPAALAALIYAQVQAGGSDPDAGADV
jgi:hypothetical protein